MPEYVGYVTAESQRTPQELKYLGVVLGTFDGWVGDEENISFMDVILSAEAHEAMLQVGADEIKDHGIVHASIGIDQINGTATFYVTTESQMPEVTINAIEWLYATKQLYNGRSPSNAPSQKS